jgi:hypothetical protein
VKDGNEPLHLCRGERGERGAIDEETRRWVRANRLQRANGEDPTRDGDGPAGRRSMSGSGSAMNTGADVREVTGSSDTRAARVHNVASCEDCEVFDEREVVANVEGEIGRSDAVRLSARGMLRRVNAQWERVDIASIFGCGSGAPATLRILSGCGAQQTHNAQRAQAVEVVRNHEDGTGERLVPHTRVEEWNLRWERGR